MDENRLTELLVAHFVQALRLAVAALDIVDLPHNITLHQLQDLESMRKELEVSTVTLLQLRGTSWGAMAGELGVARQTLHRRLAPKSLDYLDERRSVAGLEKERKRLLDLLLEGRETLATDGARRIRQGVRILMGDQQAT